MALTVSQDERNNEIKHSLTNITGYATGSLERQFKGGYLTVISVNG